MIYITGDIHGDFSRFKDPKLRKLRANDALLICGDFGFIWNGSKKENKILKKIGKLKYNILFVEGSHENYDLLEEYETSEWCGGKTRLICGNLRQLMRGQVYEIAGKKVFAFGGGQTDDISDVEEGVNWWSREMPEDSEFEEGIENLEKADNKVDFAVTYEPPSEMQDFLTGSGEKNRINSYLSEIMGKIDFKCWYFGKLHLNKNVSSKYHAVYDTIVPADLTKIKNVRKDKNTPIKSERKEKV